MVEHDAIPDWTQPRHYGAEGSGVAFAEATIAAAWNVQRSAMKPPLGHEVQRLFDVVLPIMPNTIATTGALTAVWLGPRSWLLVAGGVSPLAAYVEKRDALNEIGGALFDVGASRIAWSVSGPRAASVLAKGCPLDFHPRALSAGTCAQSHIGHVNVLFVKHDDLPTFTVMVARSYARDVWHSLLDAAAQYGIEIRAPMPYR